MSNSIDERVVVLRFDNAQFESATKTSMNTLDRLKASLKLDKSAKSLENLGKTTKTFNLSGMISAIETVGQRFSRLGIVGMTVISQLTKAAMGMAKNVLTAIPRQIAQGGWTRAMNIEQARFQIEGLGKDWGELKKNINDAVLGTAYGFDEAAKAASMLSASGYEAGENMEGYLRSIAGMAAMTGSSYDDISNIYTAIAGNGRLMADQLNQFAFRGINAAAVLGQQWGKTEDEVREMVKHSEVSFDMFAKAMDDAFGKHAKEADKTFTGSLSNMKAAMSRMGADVAEVQLFNLMRVFNAIKPIIDNVHYALEPLIIGLNKLSLAASNRLIDNLNKVKTALDPFAEKGKKLKEDWDKTFQGIKDEWEKAQDTAKGTTENISDSVDKLGHALDENGKVIRVTAEEAQAAWDIWNKGTYGNQPYREKNLAKAGLEYKYVQAYVNDLIAADFDLSKTTIEVAEATGEATEKTKEQSKATEEAAESAKKVEKVYGSLGAVFKRLNKEMKPGQKLLAAIKNVFTGLLRIVRGVARVIEPVIAAFINWFIPIFSRVSEKLKEITGRFSDFTSKVNISTEAQNKIFKAVSKFLEGVSKVGKAIAIIIKTIFEGFKKVGSAIGRLLGPIVVKIATAIKNIAEHIKTFNKEHQLAKKIIEGVTKVLSTFFDLIARGINKIRDFLQENDRLAKAGEAIKKAFEKVWEFLKGVFEGIKNFFLELKDSEGVQKLTQALKDLFNVLKDLLSLAIQKLIDNLSTLTGKTFETPAFEKAVKVLSDFSGWLGGVIEKVAEFAGKLGDGGGLKDKVVSFFKSFKDTESGERFTKFIEGLGDAFGKLKESSSGTGNMSASLLSLKDVLFPLSGATGFNAENFKNGFGGVIEWLKTIDWMDIFENDIIPLLKTVAGVKAALKFSKLLGSAASLLDSLSGMGKSVSGFVKEMTKIQKKKLRLQTFKTIALAVVLLAGALFIISKIPTEDLPRSIGILGGIVGALIGMLYLIDKAKINTANLAKIGTGMVALGAGMILIAGSIAIISRMDPKHIAKAGVVIAAFVFGMAGAARIAGQSSFGGFAKLGTALMLLSVSMLILGNMKPAKLLKAGIVIVGLVALLVIANNKAENSFKKGSNGLKQLAVAVAIISGAVVALSFVPFKRALAASVTVVAIVFALVKASEQAKGAKLGIQNMKGLATVVAVIAGSIAGLAFFKPKRILTATAGISAIMIELIAIMKMMNASEKEQTGALKFALMAVIILGSITAALAVLSTMNTQGMLAATLGLSAVLVSLAVAVGIFGTAGQLGPGLLQGVALGIAAMEMVLWALVGTFAVLAKINEATKKDGDSGIFKKIGQIFGDLIGGIMQGVGEAGLALLEQLGDTLEKIAPQFQPFFDAIGQMPEGFGENAKNLATAVLALTGASFLDGVTSLITTFTGGISGLGENLKSFGEAMVEFYDSVSAIDDWGTFSDATKAAGKIADTWAALPRLKGWSLGTFVTQLPLLGKAISDFNESINGQTFDQDQISGFTKVARAVCNMWASLPRLKGWSLGTFVNQLPKLGTAIVSFSESINGATFDVQQANRFSKVAETVTQMWSSLPRLKGWSLGTFVNQLPKLGTALKEFDANISGGEFKLTKTASISMVMKAVSNAWQSLPRVKGMSLGNFITNLPKLGSALKGFCDNASGLKTTDAVAAAAALKDISQSLSGVDTTALSNTATTSASLSTLGTNLKSFFGSTSGIDTSNTSAISSALSTLGKTNINTDTSSYKQEGAKAAEAYGMGFKSSDITKSTSALVSKAVTSLASKAVTYKPPGVSGGTKYGEGAKSTEGNITKVGGTLASGFASALRAGANGARSAGNVLGSAAKSGASGYSLYGVGENLAESLRSGIRDVAYKVANAAAAMAKAAYDAARAALQINSPSKLFMGLGSGTVEGFVKGIDDHRNWSDRAAEGMANSAFSTVASATARLSSLISDNVDTNPTITPVVDLTQVRSGANQINSLMRTSKSLSMSASISGNVAADIQNRNDLQGSLSKLSSRLDSVTDSMNSRQMINYITVDGSENPEAFADRFVRKLKLNMRTV